eukprot:maker-scaffold_6-snap-gene-15.20-mRNA-1 protein AED:0.01 eAED:0.01 QI:135/1/1/1/1/1/3/233/289
MSSIFRNDLLAGKVIFVSGGATGIGLGICKAAGVHGAIVCLGSRRQKVIEEACETLRSMNITCFGTTLDVRDENSCKSAIEQVVEKFGKIDILVNNAAGNFMVSSENLSLNAFRTVLDIDLLGTFNMSKAALGFMKKNEKSLIVNISATLHYTATPFQMHASAAKAGVDALTNVLAVEWGDYGIRVVGIAPGPIEGTVGGPTGRVFGQKKQAFSEKILPVGRFGKVEDIAHMVLYLSSEAGEFISGTSIVVDGGCWHGSMPQYRLMKKMVEDKSNLEKKTHKGGVKAKL